MATIQEALAQALQHVGARRLDDADILLRRILAVDPAHPQALHVQGIAAIQRGRAAAGAALIEKALAIHPELPGAHANLTAAYVTMGQAAEAARACERGLAVRPADADLMGRLGDILQGLGRLDEAVSAYRRVIALNPDNATWYNNLGVTLNTLGRLEEAAGIYARATALAPEDARLLSNYASILRNLGKPNEALALFRQALAIDPRSEGTHFNLANLFATAQRRADALVHYREAARLRPDVLYLQRELLYTLLFGCHFDESEQVLQRLRDAIPAGLAVETDWRRVADLIYLTVFCKLGEARHQALFDRMAQLLPEEPGAMARVRAAAAPRADGRLRIGYMTPNFGNHPVGHVTRALYGLHDRSRFEVFAFSLQDRSEEPEPFNRSIRDSVDHFQEIGHLSDADAAAAIRAHGIHILIDLNGTMTPKRLGIEAHRAAPIQVYWLGHAGGVGQPSLDYLIGDHVVIAPGEERLYREKVVRLPECYHVSDRPAIAPTVKPRAAYGLADDAFVFCAFNNPQKIDRFGFDTWMEIMRQVPGSQLWLSGNGDPVLEPNLRAAAQAAGIAPERLVFATRVDDKDEHFARHALADLFLDTFTLNASSTALDALWGGLPLLTMRGPDFPARIAASMLTALGLTELITETRDRFIAEAVALTRDPPRLKAIRARLWHARETRPLFQTERFVRHLEQAYRTMWANHAAGQPPRGFDVPVLDAAPAADRYPAPAPRPTGCGTPRCGIPVAELSNILVLKLDEIGDFILASPFLRELRRNAPEARLTLMVSPAVYDLARTCPHVDRVVPVRTAGGRVMLEGGDPGQRALVLEDFQNGRFDLAVVPRFDFDRYDAAPLAHGSRAPHVVGYSETVTALKARRNAGFDRRFYTHTLSRPAARHEVEHNLALLEFLGGTVIQDAVEVWTTAEDAEVAARLSAERLSSGRRFLAVCPGSSYPAKMFPPVRLTGIVHQLRQELGVDVMVLGGEAERALGQEIAGRLGTGAVSVCGDLTLRQAAEVIRRAHGVLSMCSAPGHIAAAVGTPVVVFSCHPLAGDPAHFHAPERFAPWCPADRRLIIQPESVLWPCKGSCEAPEHHCIGNVQDAAVAGRIAAFLRRS